MTIWAAWTASESRGTDRALIRMAPLTDICGQRFGRLTVVARAANRGTKAAWLCQCECGEATIVTTGNLRSGNTTSCGCLRRENLVAAGHRTRHGHARGEKGSPTWQSWRAMHLRCLNPNHVAYARYGGRGVTICERWLRFENFLADMGERPEGTSLDRIDANGDYEPRNCRWADALTQRHNRRTGACAS